MNDLHLSEEQLQANALGGFTDPAAVRHVAGCDRCQMHIVVYQLLYRTIREAETPLLDPQTEEFILERLPEFNKWDRKEKLYLYGVMSGAIVLLIAGLVGFWGAISWAFAGMMPTLASGLLLLCGISIAQLLGLFRSYRKKLTALNTEQMAT